MRHILTIAMLEVLGTGLVGCGSKSDPAATALCDQYSAAICERYFTCGTTDLANLSSGDTSLSDCTPKQPAKPHYFPARFACYTSASDCTDKEKKNTCSDVADTVCNVGESYHADKAQDCVTAWQALTCDDVTNGVQPIVCSEICTLPGMPNP
jgi:hypothetical protein